MDPIQYTYMREAEDHHWWYVGNHELFMKILKRDNVIKDGIRMLDAGCGTGGWLRFVKKSFSIHETGIDKYESALSFATADAPLNVIQGDVNELPFSPDCFDLISSLDVLYHREVDEKKAVSGICACLKNHGAFLVSVPAYSFLYSKHDKVVHTGRRYTKRRLKRLLVDNGFEIEKITYSVSLLFPFALIKRIFDKFSASETTDHNEVSMPPNAVNRLFLFIMRIENWLIQWCPMPFGLSVVALARKRL